MLPDDVPFVSTVQSISSFREFVQLPVKLHGSPHEITELEPRPAKDTEKAAGNLKAVYATKDHRTAFFLELYTSLIVGIGGLVGIYKASYV